MELNSKCIYDVLKYLEQNLTYQHKNGIKGITIAQGLKENSYTSEDVYYTIEILLAEEFLLPNNTTSQKNQASQNSLIPQKFKIPKSHGYNGKTVKIKSITLKGHTLLTSMAEPKTLEK